MTQGARPVFSTVSSSASTSTTAPSPRPLGRPHEGHPRLLPIAPRRKIGLLAGSGRFPILFAEAARRQGLEVYCVGIRYEAADELVPLCARFEWVSVTRMNSMIQAFQRMGIDEVVMAGKVIKNVMYTPWRILRLWPDRRTVRWWRNLPDRKDDTVLLSLIDEFARDGIRFTSALDYCPELLVDHGLLSCRPLSPLERGDVAFGWRLAKAMGGLDVGQSVAVKERAALAVEAIEGTDRCIERAGQLCKAGGWTLVKVAKPQQDMRFDVPTIGLSTIENLARARARVLAVEAQKTILIDRDLVIARANHYGITLIALTNAEAEAMEAEATAAAKPNS